MLEIKRPLEDKSYFLQLLFLVAILIAALIFFNLFALIAAVPFWGLDAIMDAAALKNLDDPSSINFLKYLQVVNQIALFIIAPLFFVFLVSRKKRTYLSLDKGVDSKMLMLSIIAIYTILPFVSWIGEINHDMQLPSFMSGVESWMLNSERQAADTMLAFLNVDGIFPRLFNLFMIALIPGIGEELLFRGVFQKIFKDWTKSVHWGVIISAFIFSFFHMQFYGFLPRFVLGLVLGYSLVYSGSLWVPIILHFLNNATAVIFVYASNSTEILEKDIESIGATNSWVVAIFSLMIVVTIIIYMRNLYIRKNVVH